MNQFSAMAPWSASLFCVFGIGPTPFNMGKEPPNIWSWSSVRNQTIFGDPGMAGGGAGVGAGAGAGTMPQVEPFLCCLGPGVVFKWQLPFFGSEICETSPHSHAAHLPPSLSHAEQPPSAAVVFTHL